MFTNPEHSEKVNKTKSPQKGQTYNTEKIGGQIPHSKRGILIQI
jgi:hypothetical protein